MNTRNHISLLLALSIPLFFWYSPPALGGPDPETGREEPARSANPTATPDEAMFTEIPTVISASRYEQGINEAPASITIVTSDEIRLFGYRNVGEVLRNTRGFYTTDDRNYLYAGVRGFSRPSDYNNRILLMIDGHSVNEKWTGGTYIGNDLGIDLELVDRIEIVRGPVSALYGSNALFAVVNVITKRPGDLPGANLSLTGGSYPSAGAGLTYGKVGQNGGGLLLSGSGFGTAGADFFYPEFNSPATNFGLAEGIDEERFVNLFGSYHVGNWTLEGKANRRKKTIPTASYGTLFNDPGTYTIDGRSFFEVCHDGITSGGAETQFRVYYDRMVYEGDFVVDYPPVTVNRDEGGAEMVGTEYRRTQRIGERQRLSVGAQYEYNFNVFQTNFDEDPFALYLDQEFDFYNYSAYLQDEVHLGSKMLLNLGVRYDYFENFGSSTSPRVALIYSPGRSTTLKALYGEAFRAPSMYELFYDDGSSTKPNPDLNPEDIRTFELVWEQRLSHRFSMVATAYSYRMENLISQFLDPMDGLLQYQNFDEVEAHGLELEISGRTPGGIFLRGAYTGQRAEDKTTGTRLTNSPTHVVQGSVAFPIIGRKSSLAIQARWVSERITFNRFTAADVYLGDVTFNSGELWDLFDVTFGVRNVLDYEYGDPGGAEHTQEEIPQDGRTFFVTFRHRF